MTDRRIPAASGFTLIELMVALAVGLLVVYAAIQLFTTSRATYTSEENMARVQENGRFAMEFLTSDLRMAGNAGCVGSLPAGSINNIASPALATSTFVAAGLAAYRYTGTGGNGVGDWTPWLPTGFFTDGVVMAGTDVVMIQYASTINTNLTGNMGVENANIQILSSSQVASEIAAGDVLMISDCKSADIFRATNKSSGSGIVTIAHSNSANTSNNLSKPYTTDAQLMKLISRAYYIAPGASGEPALFRRQLDKTSVLTEELAEGVTDMRFLFGEDTDLTKDGIANIYRRADAVSDWNSVVAVRLGLLVSTPATEAGPDIRIYDLAGISIGPLNDNRRRHAFNATVQLRN